MKRVCITGTLASGKSTLSRYLRDKGYDVFDADYYGKSLYTKDSDTYKEIVEKFGEEILDDKLEISTKKLAGIVFGNEEKRLELNGIVHPNVKNGLLDFFEERKDKDIAFAEVVLVFEVGWERLFDHIVLITCDEEISIERCMKYRNYTREEAVNRLRSQIPADIQVKKSDYVIYNNGTIEEFETSIDKWLDSLKG